MPLKNNIIFESERTIKGRKNVQNLNISCGIKTEKPAELYRTIRKNETMVGKRDKIIPENILLIIVAFSRFKRMKHTIINMDKRLKY